MKEKYEKIDFVITWVDSNDCEWQKEKNKYAKIETDETNSAIRYREWETLKYWFRAVEKYTPWVNNIYFVTCGHLPKWLNTSSEKIKIINHKDYIPEKYLPTFNSNVIELYMHKIHGLSEKFVYFNDDTFIVDKMKESDFFIDGNPRDALNFNLISAQKENNLIGHTILNNLEVLENHFSKYEVIKEQFLKVFNFRYGFANIKTILLLPWKFFSGIENQHMPINYLKSTYEEIWKTEPKRLEEMSNNKFRTKDDYNLWLFRYWQLLTGKFKPKSYKRCKYYDLENDNSRFVKNVINKKYNMVCINDSNINLDFEKVKQEIIDMFEKILPEKSEFEI